MDATETEGPRRSLKGRLATGFAAQMFDIAVRLSQSILTVPVLILGWGVEGYAAWLEAIALAGVIAGIDFGLAQHFGNRVHLSWTGGDRALGLRQLRAGLGLSIGFVAVPVLVVSVVVAMAEADATWSAALWMLAAAQALHSPRAILLHVYRAAQRYSLGLVIGSLLSAAQLALLCAAVWLGLGITGAAALTLGLTVATCAILVVDLRYRFGLTDLSPAAPTRLDLQELRRSMPGFSALIAANAIIVHGPILLLSLMGATAQATVIFSVTRTMANLVRQVIGQFWLTGGNEMAEHKVRGELDRLDRIFVQSCRLVMAAGGLCAGLLAAFAPMVVPLWTHGAVPGDPTLLLVILAGMVMGAPGQFASLLPTLSNKPHQAVLAQMTWAAGGFILAAALYGPHGLLGLALGYALAETLGAGVQFQQMRRDLPLTTTLKGWVVGFAAFVAVAAVAGANGLVTQGLATLHGWVGLGLEAFAALALVAPFTLVLMLTAHQRHWLRGQITTRLRRLLAPG